jgi:hypothetical protein
LQHDENDPKKYTAANPLAVALEKKVRRLTVSCHFFD